MFLHPFTDFPTYSDTGSVNQLCRNVLSKEIGGTGQLQIGVCAITGPGQVAEDAHQTWTQFFVVVEGQGTLFYDGKPFPVKADAVVKIPKGTKHYVQCAEGESIRYLFVNMHDL